jgi:hypothetical protein
MVFLRRRDLLVEGLEGVATAQRLDFLRAKAACLRIVVCCEQRGALCLDLREKLAYFVVSV